MDKRVDILSYCQGGSVMITLLIYSSVYFTDRVTVHVIVTIMTLDDDY